MSKLDQDSILTLFREFACWMARRDLRAEVVVGGGTALLLQTHLKDTTSDIDMILCRIKKNGRPYREVSQLDLVHQFSLSLPRGRRRKSIDRTYSETMVRGFYGKTCTPYINYCDQNGNGITVHLLTVEQLFKDSTANTKLVLYPPLKCLKLSHYEEPHLKILRGHYALMALLDHEARGGSHKTIDRKYKRAVTRHVPLALAEELQAKASRGRKPLRYQTCII